MSRPAQPDPAPPPAATGPDPLDQVRIAAAEVAGRAHSVRVDARRVRSYAGELLDEGALDPGRDDVHDPWRRGDGDPDAVAGRVLALDAINFGSGWHPVVRKRLGPSGARNMANGLRAWLADAVDPARLARLDRDTAHLVFDQPHDGGPVDELMGLFTVALNDLGRLVLDHFDGSFVALIEGAEASAARLVGLLTEMPFFDDVSTHDELEVPLYKRAQLAAADLHRAFGGVAPGRFHDLGSLTAFADNLVPHVLRLDGVLRYDDALARRIEAGELLAAGGHEEVEIRAVGVHAVELLRAALADRGREVPSWRLDAVLWERGGGARYKAVPRHRARSVFY